MVKKIFGYIVAFPILLPFIIFVHVARIFIGKEKAVQICGPYATSIAKSFLGIMLPKIYSPKDFHLFRSKTKENFWLWKPIYDFEIKEESEDILKLNILNCPFCELLPAFKLSELNSHVCQGDWEFAKENEGLWTFERIHEIGKGDSFCDHTYKRITS
mgnify:FL=1